MSQHSEVQNSTKENLVNLVWLIECHLLYPTIAEQLIPVSKEFV